MKKTFAIVLAVLFVATSAWAEFKVPQLTGPVVDQAGILSRRTERVLESALRALKDKSGTQITVLTVPSLEGLSIEEASIKVVDKWQLGKRGEDRGVLFMVAPQERRVRIEVGRGLEGDLTDVDSKRIIEESVLPLFRAGDYDSGVIVGVFQIAKKTDPEVDLTPYLEGKKRRVPTTSDPTDDDDDDISTLVWFVILFIAYVVLVRGPGRRKFYRLGKTMGRWPDDFGGPWGGGGFGGGFGGGGSGGGRWGGGGGGFAGGGASGGW